MPWALPGVLIYQAADVALYQANGRGGGLVVVAAPRATDVQTVPAATT